jgi:hypothetical protein
MGLKQFYDSYLFHHWCFCQDFKRAGISRLLKYVKEKGREQFLAKKGQFALYKEKL